MGISTVEQLRFKRRSCQTHGILYYDFFRCQALKAIVHRKNKLSPTN